MDKLSSRWEAFQNSYYFWDWITLACGWIAIVGLLAVLVGLLGLPGRIAVARKHPDAEAVYALGWVGFLAIVPWIQAFIWAFKPTEKVDVRRFPDEERKAEEEDLARLKAYAYGKKTPFEKKTSTMRGALDTATSVFQPDSEEPSEQPVSQGEPVEKE